MLFFRTSFAVVMPESETSQFETSPTEPEIRFRHPCSSDAAQIWQLVCDSGVLDVNSSYLYLLLCRDFADTCAVAEANGRIVGFVTGYRPPKHADSLFVWQIGVDESARGQGVATRLLLFLLETLVPAGVRFVEATVADSNTASQRLFAGLAQRLQTALEPTEGFAQSLFPDGGTEHEAEPGVRVGPLDFPEGHDSRSVTDAGVC